MKYKPYDEIIVKLNGKEYISYIDSKGVQRFKTNSVVNDIFNIFNINLNTLSFNFLQGKYTKQEWIEFYTMIDYSLDGFSCLSDFQDVEIENPLWEDEDIE